MARTIRLWWALVAAWLLSILPALHADDDERRGPAIARTQQRHDPDADSELPNRALVEPQRAQIAPVQAPPIRQFVAQPRWEDYEADHWAVQRAMQATSRGNCAAFALRSTWPPSPGTPSAAPS